MAEMELIHDKLSLNELEDFEIEQGLNFPESYRDFLLKYNGGYVNPNVFYISSEEGESAINIFYGIGNMYNNLEKKLDLFDDLIDIGFIPIASDSGGNQICLGVNEKYFEQVYFWNHEQETDELMESMHYLGENINKFLNSLYESE
ncbi:SMI1/KNR4 family protein [Oceanobacillus sp. CFH 90083]|uniref:SMI1/KNR4 family protein n=1 Tax=Oceanobacillus sp. CFH 90083 TaxID=2592336 RepID=UPI00128CE6C6|nr:SMI1/KNR4 family protein [Oceanobacillus sp. CFH 90083]